MKPRHVSAVALVGWYLLMPPISHDKDGHLESIGELDSIPLSRWKTEMALDNALECNQAVSQWQQLAKKELKQKFNTADANGVGLAIERANSDERDQINFLIAKMNVRCIASDDSRLNPK